MPKAAAKTVVLTGVTRGLGRAMAAKFVSAGHTIVGCGRDRSAAEQLRRRYGAPHRFAAVDVADDAAVGRWADSVLEGLSPPDLLVNNAGLINANAPLWEISAEEFSAVIDVNVKGTANLIRHFVPAMAARGSGVIVNFSSTWGRSVSPEVAPYCAAKWAVEGLTRALARELPRGMAAVPLNPGVINTEMLQSCLGAAAHSYPGPDEWAASAVPFLLSLGPEHNGEPLTVGR